MWDDRLVSLIIEGNIPWRIIGKRRKLKSNLEKYLDGIINQMDLDEELGIGKRGYMKILMNNVKHFKNQYWDVNKYEEYIERNRHK